MADRHARCASTSPRVSVLLPLPLAGAYDYVTPDGEALAPGDFVTVPLGRRSVAGVVWGAGEGGVEPEKLRSVDARLPAPPLKEELRRLIDWVAHYTLAPPGAVLRMAMSVADALEPPRSVIAFGASAAGKAALAADDSVLTKTRRRVLAVVADGPPLPAKELARQAACGTSVVRALADLGFLTEAALPVRHAPPVPDWQRPGPVLSEAQRAAAQELTRAIATGGYSVTVLDGVTGSGKTEVYFEAIAAALAQGRQALVLLPEIALGAQWLARFAERFGAPPVEWHSDLAQTQRRDSWRAVADGSAKVVVGARSALFLPFAELGLIIVDEEQDASYKQEDGVVYQARDMAVVRASLAKLPIVLVSATPSLETTINVQQGRYKHVHLPSRHGAARLPEIRLIDMRLAKLEARRFLSPPLVEALKETLAAGEQAMLFLNRRGYAPLTLCRACGHRLECPHCTAWLVEHRLLGQLQCHHCGYSERQPPFCPSCHAAASFAPCGPGVERLNEEMIARFPTARILVMASDTLTGPRAAAEIMSAVEEHRIDVIIGTQVVAKGHHFPLLTLVGVVDADLGLKGGDLRAAERTFQLLHQVAGRAGRADRPGQVLIQTYMPDQPVMRALASNARDGFLAAEAASREAESLPPYGRLAALILAAGDDDSVDFTARAFARAAPQMPGVETWGPAPAPLAILRGRHRRRFLVKAKRGINLQAVLRQWLGRVKVPGAVRVQVDIDPYSFL
jgi:primosomal protein N' (replication factor Y) (superfamily II helicase)